MHVAVCTQNEETRSILSHLFKMYEEKSACSVIEHFYKNSIDLLYDLVGGEYDVIFFSNFRHENIAEEIREKDRRVRLVLLTGLDSMTQEESDIWYCLPEPPSSAFLFPIFDRLRVDTERENTAGLLIKSKGSVMQLPFFSIEYVEVMGKSVFFHLTDGSTEEVFGSFSAFEARLLCWPDFIKVHRAYILNIRHVQKLENGGVITRGGHSVPVSKRLYPQFKKDYLCSQMDPDTKAEAAESLQTNTVSPVQEKDYETEAYCVLLIDDEEDQRQRWSQVLTAHGCHVQTAYNGETAMELAALNRFDCVVLDVKLGSERGFDLCAALKDQTGAPIVFLSSLDDSSSQTQGFLAGGIDYITKDTTDELFWIKMETRIKIAKQGKAELVDGNLLLNLKMRKTYFKGQEITLTAVEFDILNLLMQNSNVVYTPMKIYESVWGTKPPDNGQAVHMHLSQLGRKLAVYAPGHIFIETVWGKGYRFISMSERKGSNK